MDLNAQEQLRHSQEAIKQMGEGARLHSSQVYPCSIPTGPLKGSPCPRAGASHNPPSMSLVLCVRRLQDQASQSALQTLSSFRHYLPSVFTVGSSQDLWVMGVCRYPLSTGPRHILPQALNLLWGTWRPYTVTSLCIPLCCIE